MASGKIRLRDVIIKTWGTELFLYGEHLGTHLSQALGLSPLLSPQPLAFASLAHRSAQQPAALLAAH